MKISEAIFIICANCGEWAWNGLYRYSGFVMLDNSFEIPNTVCFCCVREQMNAENLWFDFSLWEAAKRYVVDKNLICKN